jgi:hypothetical protein
MPKSPPDIEVHEVSPETSPPPAKPPLQDRVAARWLRIEQAIKYSGINRSKMFRLIADGAVKSASVKEQGATRGIRLVDRYDLDLFLEKLCLPIEQKLVHEAQALAQKEADLGQQQAALSKKQRELNKELEAVRERRYGGPLPSTTTTHRKPKPVLSRKR